MQRVCVFCGANTGAGTAYREAAVCLGRTLAEKGVEVVFGGGGIGLMRVVADAVMGAGGRMIGVIPEALVAKELAHRGVRDMRVVRSMHERKALMAELSDGFIALPGGFGTFEEFCEVLTWTQLGLHAKPCALLNVAGYFDALLRLFDHAVAEEFVVEANRQLVLVDDDPARLLEKMTAHHAPHVQKWIGRNDT
jgi:uncharacterized protein (TIGR00730 family)